MLSLDYYLKEAQKLAYKVHGVDDDTSRLNIVGWRNVTARPDHFDCYISVYWKDFVWMQEHFPATTYPGVPWLLNPMKPEGTAVLAPGFYEGGYKLGKHRRKYTALVQRTEVKVYRDLNRNADVDPDFSKVHSGMFGINIHKAGIWSKLVGVSSAGCQVLSRSGDFNHLVYLCEKNAALYDNIFNYTLMEF